MNSKPSWPERRQPVNYQLEISPEAQREIKALPGYVRTQALQLLETIRANPRLVRTKELEGKPDFYRIWLAGKWRIVYRVVDELVLISVIRVRRKEQIDYARLCTLTS